MKRRTIGLLVLAMMLVAPAAYAAEDILIAGFEGKDYGEWKVTGEAFGPGPARGTLPGQMRVSGYQGKGLVNTFYKGDNSTGTLTSPPITIQRKYVCFLIGGGMHRGATCINLLVEGKVVRTATGPNDRPGGSEALAWESWDVADLAGKTATIQIVDRQKGGWGHVNIDHILQSDTKRQAPKPVPAEREITITKRYLHLPVTNAGRGSRMRFTIDGKTVREFGIQLATGEPDFWVFSDVSAFQGKTIKIEMDRAPGGAKALAAIKQADQVPNAEGMYKEKHRQQFHFSSRRGWNNDSNGLVYYKGEYHLYYQHNPYGWKWGNMHWGHAVSRDLVHWKELPVAIYPFRYGDWVFSGSAAVDWNNTAGFKTGENDVIVAAYTSTGRGEAIAYSNDRGRTFTDYEGNPVVKHSGRDPKIIWYEPGKHWVMAVYHILGKRRTIGFFTSADLKKWTYQSCTESYHECPEIFELPVDGDKKNTRWVVYGGDGNYAIGSFDGKTFTEESGKHRFSHGNCFYASQTFSDIPPEDGRRIQIAWGRIATPGMPFNQCMLFPVVLTLRTTEEGIRMFAVPVKEIETIHGRKHAWKDRALKEGENPLAGITGELFDIRAELQVTGASEVGFTIRGTPVVYDVKKAEMSCKRRKAPLKPTGGKIRLQILVDRTSIEIFANDGRVYMPIGGILPDDNRTLAVFAKGGAARLGSLEVYELRSAWE
jgi:fructan beta-fructosidase